MRTSDQVDSTDIYICSDGNIRYFEYENDKFEFLSEYKSADPQRGIAFLPKRGVNVCETNICVLHVLDILLI